LNTKTVLGFVALVLAGVIGFWLHYSTAPYPDPDTDILFVGGIFASGDDCTLSQANTGALIKGQCKGFVYAYHASRSDGRFDFRTNGTLPRRCMMGNLGPVETPTSAAICFSDPPPARR
jgi:hypothetical protein